MKPLLAVLFIGAAVSFSAIAAEPVAPTIHPLLDGPVSGDTTRHAVVIMADWPVSSTTGLHTHPGDEYATVLKGTVEVMSEGKGPRIYKAGEAYYNARDVVHETRNAGAEPAQTVAILIVDKDMALSQPVK